MWVVKKIVFFLVFFHLIGAALIWGQRMNVHAHGGVASPRQANIKEAFESGFGFSYSLSHKIWISFDFEYWKSRVDENPQELLKGKLTMTPFLVSINHSILNKINFFPYVSLGIGYIFYDFRLGDIITIPEITITQSVANRPAIQVGIGGQRRIWERLALYIETLYLYTKSKGVTTITDLNFGVQTEEFSLDLSTLVIKLGIRYQF